MELAGLEPATSWVRSRRFLVSNQPHFQGFSSRHRAHPVTSCRRITRGFSAIWSQVLRPVARSVVGLDARLSYLARPRPSRRPACPPIR